MQRHKKMNGLNGFGSLAVNCSMWQSLQEGFFSGDTRALARCISLVENEVDGYEAFLESLPIGGSTQVIGITGPPGAGKSTLTDGMIESLSASGKKVAVLCIDPSSPFNFGAILGDRIRMGRWHNHPNVYIRSLASRGSLGGLHPKAIEITELLKAAQFDVVIIETVGVGQSEVEISGLADLTLVVLVPESGDEVQTMKAGLMEIADIFVVNKADRPEADVFVSNLLHMLAPSFSKEHPIPVIKTVAAKKEGIDQLIEAIGNVHSNNESRRTWLLTERAYQLIAARRMRDVSRNLLKQQILQAGTKNLYRLLKELGY